MLWFSYCSYVVYLGGLGTFLNVHFLCHGGIFSGPGLLKALSCFLCFVNCSLVKLFCSRHIMSTGCHFGPLCDVSKADFVYL